MPAKKKPSDPFIVLRPVPSRRWKQKVRQAARRQHTSMGKYLIAAANAALERDGLLDGAKPDVQEAPAVAAAE